jgi:hypothetical protein
LKIGNKQVLISLFFNNNWKIFYFFRKINKVYLLFTDSNIDST